MMSPMALRTLELLFTVQIIKRVKKTTNVYQKLVNCEKSPFQIIFVPLKRYDPKWRISICIFWDGCHVKKWVRIIATEVLFHTLLLNIITEAHWKHLHSHCACMCVRAYGEVALPNGCFRYRAVKQRAQTSVETPHPMAVHCLLHTVDCRRFKRKIIMFCINTQKQLYHCQQYSCLYFHCKRYVLFIVALCGSVFLQANTVCAKVHRPSVKIYQKLTDYANKWVCSGSDQNQTTGSKAEI